MNRRWNRAALELTFIAALDAQVMTPSLFPMFIHSMLAAANDFQCWCEVHSSKAAGCNTVSGAAAAFFAGWLSNSP